MRLWLCPSAFAPHRGGVEELTLKLAQHLARRGHDVLVVTNRFPAHLPIRAMVEGVDVRRVAHTLPTRRPSSLVRHVRAARHVQNELDRLPPPDLVHEICLSSQMGALRPYAQRRSVPVVLTTQGETAMDAQAIYQRSPWLRAELRRSARSAAALTACSSWTRSHAARFAPEFSGAQVVLNGVDVEDWRAGPLPDAPVFAAWGRHVREKGFDLLLDGFARLRVRLPEAQLLLGGDGPERPRLVGAAGVQLLGPLDRVGVRELLSRARVVVVPSRVEPFGIVALEALAAGRGLVHSVHGGLAEAAGGCGRAVDPRDADALADAMLAELQEPTPAADGVQRATDLSWERIVTEYEAVYESVRMRG